MKSRHRCRRRFQNIFAAAGAFSGSLVSGAFFFSGAGRKIAVTVSPGIRTVEMGVDFRTVLFGTFCSGLIPSGSDAAGIGIAGTFVVFDIIVVAGFFDQAGFIKGFSAGGTGGTAAYLSFRVAVDFAGTRTGTVFGVTDFAAFPGSAAAVGTIIVSIRTAGFV